MTDGGRNGSRLQEELEELKGLAERVNLEVREEELLREVGYRARSGRCRIKERHVLLIDRKLPLGERLEALANELAKYNLEGMYLSPAVRRRLDRCKIKREEPG